MDLVAFVVVLRTEFCGSSVGPAVLAILPERPGLHSRPDRHLDQQEGSQ